MSIRKLATAVLAGVTLAASSLAFAANANPTPMQSQLWNPGSDGINNGYYIEGNLGYGEQRYNLNNLSPTQVNRISGSFTGNLNVGYKFNKYLAAEIGGGGFTNGNYDYSGDAAVRLMFPLPMGFNVFGKGGFGFVGNASGDGNNNTHDVEATMLAAIGLGYNISDHLMVQAQATNFWVEDSEHSDIVTYTGGLTYTF